MEIEKHRNLLASAVLGGAIILSTAIGAWTHYSVRALDFSLSVTGSAKQQVTSDQAKWVTNISRVVGQSQVKVGYGQLSQDLTIVKKFFKDQGVDEKDLTISPVFMDQIYKQNDVGEKEYNLRQTIEYNSSDVVKVTAMSKAVTSVIDQGVLFSTQSLEYYYSKLADLRVSLLSSAIKDAKARATAIAKETGRSVGSLREASSGVVQVLPLNSVDVSDYGMYDTGNIEKEVMVTVKAAFAVK
jgi:uncharacterized protein